MAKKLWDKGIKTDEFIERFTVGRDREMDLKLAEYDVKGTIAHITMLESVGLLEADELQILTKELILMIFIFHLLEIIVYKVIPLVLIMV